jgi:hypothetical protein
MVVSPTHPWRVSETDFPSAGNRTEQIRFLLNYAVLAPSGHNSQPWLFQLAPDHDGPGAVDLYADRSRALPVVDPDDRELIMSCGSALFHLRLAMRSFGFADHVTPFPDPGTPDLLARVQPDAGGSRTATDEERALFAAIGERRTHRKPFEDRAIPRTVLTALQQAAATEGAWLHPIEGEETRSAVADLVAEGNRIQGADPRFRRELAAWMHPNHSRSRDGMPGYAHGIGHLVSTLFPLAIRAFDWGQSIAHRDRQLATRAPALVVVGTDEQTPAAWLAAGQALARVLLCARANDIQASFLNQPIEVAEVRPRLQAVLHHPGHAQLLLRMGYGREVRPTPRRPVSDVLVESKGT